MTNDKGVHIYDVDVKLTFLLHVQVNCFLPYSENRSGVPYWVGWGCKGWLLDLEHDEAYIRPFVVFIGNVAGDTINGSFEIVGAVRFGTVKCESGDGCILSLEPGLGHNITTVMSLAACTAEIIPTVSALTDRILE